MHVLVSVDGEASAFRLPQPYDFARVEFQHETLTLHDPARHRVRVEDHLWFGERVCANTTREKEKRRCLEWLSCGAVAGRGGGGYKFSYIQSSSERSGGEGIWKHASAFMEELA